MKRKREKIKKRSQNQYMNSDEPRVIGGVRIRRWMTADEIAHVRKVQKEKTRQYLKNTRAHEKAAKKLSRKNKREARKRGIAHFFAHYFYGYHN